MKKLLLLTLIVASSLLTNAQDKKQQKADAKAQQEQLIKELVDADTFIFRVERASSTYGNIAMEKSVGMIMSPEKISVNLPFNGNSSGAQWGGTGDNIMDFTSDKFTLTKETIQGKRPHTDYVINAKRDNSSETYRILITVQSMGETSISITPARASNMRYYGKITNK